MVPNHEPVLYTSLERNGALAEIAFHWGQLNPQPSKQVVVHSIEVEVRRALPLTVKDLDRLGVDWSTADTGDVRRTQEIGAAAAHLSFDSMIVPSARRDCKNLVVMFTNHGSDQHRLVTKASEIVEWRLWISSN
jgi:RES domain-containing protein